MWTSRFPAFLFRLALLTFIRASPLTRRPCLLGVKKKKKVLLFILLTESFFFSLRCWITFTYGLVFKFRAELFFLFSCAARSCWPHIGHVRSAYASEHLYIACFFFSRLPFSSSFFLFINFFSLCHMYHFILEYKSHEVTVGTHV